MKTLTQAVLAAVIALAAAPARAALSVNLDAIAAQAASLGGVSARQAADFAAAARGEQGARVVLASSRKKSEEPRHPSTVLRSDGVTGFRSGNTTMYSNGVTEFHNGNTSMRSDGVTGFTSGNTTIYSNGRVCTNAGSIQMCN